MGVAPFKARDRAALIGGMLGALQIGASTNTRRSSYLLTHFFCTCSGLELALFCRLVLCISQPYSRSGHSPPHVRGSGRKGGPKCAGYVCCPSDRSATLGAYDTIAWAIDRTVIGGLPECLLVLQMAFVIRLEGATQRGAPYSLNLR
jgi:hypothetical protein